jgi:hypothetical protein
MAMYQCLNEKFFHLFSWYHEEGGSTFIRNIGYYFPKYMTPNPRNSALLLGIICNEQETLKVIYLWE